ncbi:hypothetical protein HNQ36_002022 [Afipia massiliensis]|uniref:Mitochondrial inner membrane protein n=1 Tax=Afipia massiliensis TaxID=211460 RepID=A0A840N2C0_9BRAD|nr:hypothetical protein [Afipia massiliensis]MBB5052048.1 hypothetical protein [Afipia massiliensis]
MDDDKQDKAGIPPGGDAAKRPPPTIELTASNVSDSAPASDAAAPDAAASDAPQSEAPASDHAEPSPAAKVPSRTSSILVSALTGAAAAALVLGVAKSSGWLDAPVQKPPDAVSKNDVDALGTRIAKIETDAAKPVPAPRPVADPAIVTRLDAVEKSLTSLRNDVAAARGHGEKVVAALNEIKSAPPQAVISQSAPAGDTSALEERLGKIERATAALSAAAAAPPPAPPAPLEDPNVRRMATATALDSAVRQGEPYAATLTAARSAGGDTDVLKPLDAFAATGVPTAGALSRELLTLLPKLTPKPEAQPAPSGIVERLQQSAAKLVRVQRTDAAASGNAAILARITSAAQRDDVAEAKRELMQLPASDRAPVQAWIAKMDAREAALAASRQFAADTMAALSKSAR